MKIRNRYLTTLIGIVAVALVRLLFRTCRIEIATEVPGCCPYEDTGDRRFLYCVWHDDILMTVFCGRPKRMAGLVSPHQDGSYLAEAMQRVGITSVRGSSKRGASRAMRELLDRVRDLHVAITPDGPRGPRRQMKTGIIFLASRSGRVIIPTAYACRNPWRIRGNWTDMQLPRPFTKVHARGGPAFVVPPDLEREELEVYAQRLQVEMERQEAIALRAVGQLDHADASADERQQTTRRAA
ncbi:MAG TPA: lysophospholipid acyltransferase family protein [Planctomycetaceae bacterium]|nr:lysophospholipid acyltransferase family protein [Planctomycetaceae bacterium]